MRMLYLDLDTLRPDHLGCYGYHRNTSPNVDRIASEGVVFDNYYASDAPCLPSRAAMMSGQFGIHTNQIGHDGICADRRIDEGRRGFRDSLCQISLPNTLRRAGLHTTYIGGFGERHSTYTYYAGFREIHDTGKGGMESAEDVTPTVLDWIEGNARKDNWYLHVNYWDPHTPYRAPAEFGNPFEDEPIPVWLTQKVLDDHMTHAGPHTVLDIAMWSNAESDRFPRQPGEAITMERVKDVFDGYDCGIRYMDDHIGILLDALEEQGVLDDLIIVVSADHGENLGELGLYGEHGTADQITCRIPFIVRWPGKLRGGQRRASLHYNLDWVATVAEMLGVSAQKDWDSLSFASSLQDDVDEGRDYLVVSQCAHVCQRSVRWDNYLYMRTYHDGYHSEFEKEMLFDLKNDPYEQNNLAAQRPELVKEAVYKLNEWHDEMMLTQLGGSPIDPMWIVMNSGGPTHSKGWHASRYGQRLRDTGRGEKIKILKTRHPVALADEEI